MKALRKKAKSDEVLLIVIFILIILCILSIASAQAQQSSWREAGSRKIEVPKGSLCEPSCEMVVAKVEGKVGSGKYEYRNEKRQSLQTFA